MKSESKQTNPANSPETNQPKHSEKGGASPNPEKQADRPESPSAWRLQIQEWREEHFQVTVRQIFNRAGAEAEDLVHEAIVRTAVHWDRYKPDLGPFHNWFYRILIHCMLDHFRRVQTKQKYSDPTCIKVAPSTFVDPELPDSDRLTCFQSVLNGLAPKHLDLLLAFYDSPKPLEEFASELGVETCVVKMRLFRARHALAAALRKAGYQCLDDVEKFGPTRLPRPLIANLSAGSKAKLRRRPKKKRRSKLLPGSALVRKSCEPKQTIKPK